MHTNTYIDKSTNINNNNTEKFNNKSKFLSSFATIFCSMYLNISRVSSQNRMYKHCLICLHFLFFKFFSSSSYSHFVYVCCVCVKFFFCTSPPSSRHNCDLLWFDKWMQLYSARAFPNTLYQIIWTIKILYQWFLKKYKITPWKTGKTNKQLFLRNIIAFIVIKRIKIKIEFFSRYSTAPFSVGVKRTTLVEHHFVVAVVDVPFACIFPLLSLLKRHGKRF